MSKVFLRVLPLSFLLAILFTAFSAGHAFAAGIDLNCNPYAASTNLPYTSSGNVCPGAAGFSYEPLSQRRDAIAEWVDEWDYSYINTCEVEVWLPYGNLSSDTATRYDFWYGDLNTPISGGATWLAWPGHNINQYTAPAGWYVLTSNLPVYRSGGLLQLTAHDAGGSGDLAFAGARFTCS